MSRERRCSDRDAVTKGALTVVIRSGLTGWRSDRLHLPNGDRFPLGAQVGCRRLAAVRRADVVGDDLLEVLRNPVALEGDGLLAVDEYRGDGHLAGAGEADPHVRHL